MLPTGVLEAPKLPFIIMLKAVTPEPNKTPLINCCGVCVLVTTIGWATADKKTKNRVQIAKINFIIIILVLTIKRRPFLFDISCIDTNIARRTVSKKHALLSILTHFKASYWYFTNAPFKKLM